MASNRGVVYLGPGKVEVQSIDYPKFAAPNGKSIEHGVILKIVSTNICGSDQHMVRGRTTAPAGLVLGHEITGEVIEKGKDVEYLEVGDLVTVPFNVACGRCRTCREQQTGVCLNVNPARAGGAYGYVDMGGWVGGQAEYVMVPYADFNLLKFPDKAQAMAKIRDLTMLSDILPTGFHGAVTAASASAPRSTSPGPGPVGLAAAASAQILGAAVVMIGDMNPERLAHAKPVGFEPIDLTKSDKLEELIEPIVGHAGGGRGDRRRGLRGPRPRHAPHDGGAGHRAQLPDDDHPRRRARSGSRASMSPTIPARQDEAAQQGNLRMRFGLGWAKSHRLLHGPDAGAALQPPADAGHPARSPADREDRQRHGDLARRGAGGLPEFRSGAAKKFVIDPHKMVA